MTWLPIDDPERPAPKDGTEILAYHPSGAIWHVRWEPENGPEPNLWTAARYDYFWEDGAFTHWMPPPPPPHP